MSKFLLIVCAALGLLLSSASAQDEAKDEAFRKEGLQKFEFTRFVASGKKIRLDFAYAVNPDCSPVEGSIEMKTTTEPAHGTVEIVSGDGFPVFAKTSVRFKCNEKKTRGSFITYKANEKYVGSDKFVILILYPSGYAREVSYNVNVK